MSKSSKILPSLTDVGKLKDIAVLNGCRKAQRYCRLKRMSESSEILPSLNDVGQFYDISLILTTLEIIEILNDLFLSHGNIVSVFVLTFSVCSVSINSVVALATPLGVSSNNPE